MGYLHIENLYKNQDILFFKRCYALEKIHGTSAHISLNSGNLNFSSGGEKHDNFVKLFDADALKEKLSSYGVEKITVYGEAYGGKCQGMSATYGKVLRFVAFDVMIDGDWLTVPKAEKIVKNLGLEFVHYEEISTDISDIDAQRDADSIQAVRNGMGFGHKREGVVLRPLIECMFNAGRIITKHKRDEFRETKSPRTIDRLGIEKVKAMEDANEIAEEWVTATRLQHVLDKIPGHSIVMMKIIIDAMIEDIVREATSEIVDSKEARAAIGRNTAIMYKKYLKSSLCEGKHKFT